jgi:hypothetical protein
VFVARPYQSEFVAATEKEVNEMIVGNSRPLMKMRFSKPRKEFSGEARNLIDREGGESYVDIKPRNMKLLHL